MTNARPAGRHLGFALGTVCIGLMLNNNELLAAICPTPANSNIFNATLCVDGQVATVGANNILSLARSIKDAQLKQQFATYNLQVSAAQFEFDFRGLPMTLNYGANSTLLSFSVPSLGVFEAFNGGTRDASNQLFVDWLKNHADSIFREMTRVSPMEPLAGNPASLQSDMVSGAFDVGMNPSLDSLQPGNSFGVGARFGSYGVDRFTQNVYTLPMSYAYTFGNHDHLVVQLPLSYIEVQGASAYRGMLSISYKRNVSSRWALTPSLGYGVAGSVDLGSLGHIVSGSVTSDLMLYDHGNFSLSMGNLVGYYMSMPVRLGDYSVNYNLKNTITRDGLLLSIPLAKEIWGQQLSVDFFAIGTWFFGDVLYNDKFQEFGISIGPRRAADKRAPNLSSHPFGLGISYIHGGKGASGFEMNFSYRF